ncbi:MULTISPECIES: cation:proton antiporter [Novosphingobium]|jgi:monovalent cation:H+ antiporter-2, CPA2 family|uniref:Sodium/hydrogen exchanger n=1 Tax=Novosphingobium subterraneum TaxID=48936 RepID=A0A0B8ZU37_9SPHN|nr:MULTISPECIES: cation:proton antiporter [Novosphingobium]KHS46613.1 sodium/hydrogen exchanger [Novosphingobium subterraneum]QOV93288.1 cation:proton antiporter [Novosphingobium sp. ES2-1]
MAGNLEPTTALSDALVILGAAGIVIPAFARFRITPIIGFILVGLVVGPFGLGALVPQYPWLYHFTISDPAAITPFAEFGIILLLFEIGLELSFNRLWDMRRLVFGLGAMELGISAFLLSAALLATGLQISGAFGLGLALALSSTALVLPIAGTHGPVGRAALSMLLFEDIALVPIIFILGAMGPVAAHSDGPTLGETLLYGGIVIAVLLVGGRLLLPRLFAQAAQTKSPELFLAATMLVVIAAALSTSLVGLSPIMGALLAGLLIAETEYHTEVEAITKPFKGLALGVFLITIGMGIDLRVVWAQIGPLTLAVVGVVVLKALVTMFALRAMGKERATALEAGILMASPSETTLIVLTTAAEATLIDRETAQFWQIVTAIGLTITPLLAKLGETWGQRVARGTADVGQNTFVEEPEGERVVVMGFGRVGRLIAEMLTVHKAAWLGIDSDPGIVRNARKDGLPVLFGNVDSEAAIARLGLDDAKAMILTMDEPVLILRMVKRLRSAHPDLPIIVRARDATHAAALYKAGASHAVPETLESSLQLSEAVLVDLGFPMGPVIASIHEKRDELRQKIKEEGELNSLPKLKSASLRERSA